MSRLNSGLLTLLTSLRNEELSVYRLSVVPSREVRLGSLSESGTRAQIKVLPSMNLKTLRAKSLKALKIRPANAAAATVRLFALLTKDDTDEAVTIEMDCDTDSGREIDFWGLENGSGVGVLAVD